MDVFTEAKSRKAIFKKRSTKLYFADKQNWSRIRSLRHPSGFSARRGAKFDRRRRSTPGHTIPPRGCAPAPRRNVGGAVTIRCSLPAPWTRTAKAHATDRPDYVVTVRDGKLMPLVLQRWTGGKTMWTGNFISDGQFLKVATLKIEEKTWKL